MGLRRSFRDPVPQILDAARYLDAAVSAHIQGEFRISAELFALANSSQVREWLESIWGKDSVYVVVNKMPAPQIQLRVEARMPAAAQIAALHKRDGYYCRYCGIPVVRADVRKRCLMLYPHAVTWGSANSAQHAGFQALWAQYDHVVPHSCGGTNELENLVVSCAACNFGKMSYRLEELGLLDPREFQPVQGPWDGLERLLTART